MATYGFGPSYWRGIFKKLGHTKSSDGTRAEMMMDERRYIEYLESLETKGSLEIEQIAASV